MIILPIVFRKIPASLPLFKEVKEKNKTDYEYFLNYANHLTESAGKAKGNVSGKGINYANHLIKLVIFYQENFGGKVSELLTFSTLREIEKVIQDVNFRQYNDDEKRFPNAAFNCYVSCVTHISAQSEKLAEVLIDDLEDISERTSVDDETVEPIKRPRKKGKKSSVGDISKYPTSKRESTEAKRRAEWKCELNPDHETFLNKNDDMPFMEGHHLIPMAAQDYYDNTIDFADNIVCLCPNCHRKIHHAKYEEKKETVRYLFEKRKDLYENYGISINMRRLFSFYGIN